MELFLYSNPLTHIFPVTKLHFEPRPIPPNPGRANHGLIFFLEGESGFIFDGKTVKVEPGSLLYLPKGGPYGFVREHHATCLRFNFETAHEAHHPAFAHIYSNASQFKELFLHMYHIQNSKRAGYEAMLMSTAYKIISLIQANESASYISNRHYQKIAPSVEYLKNNFLDNSITIPMLAQMSGVSPRYYTMLFNAFFMCSPKQYIINLKVDLSKKLLSTTDQRIHNIAEVCGFSDVYYFCKIFKKATNMSPTEFRKKNSYL